MAGFTLGTAAHRTPTPKKEEMHMLNRRILAAVVVVSTSISLAALAQGKPPGRGADACALVSKVEIEQALGVTLGDGTKNPNMQNPGVLSSCDYTTPGGGQVGILIRRSSVKYVVGSEKAAFEKQGLKLRYLTGLGTTAFFIDMFGMGTELGIFRGDYDYAQVSAMATGGNAAKTASGLEKLGRLVLDRWK
jgi:hypothetical protein